MLSECPLLKLVGLFSALHLTASVSWAGPVLQGERVWIQPSDITPVTWLEVDAVCPAPERICDGSIKSVDVSGYRWATTAELQSLMLSYGALPTLTTNDSTTIDGFLQDFVPNGNGLGSQVLGWSSEQYPPDSSLARVWLVQDSPSFFPLDPDPSLFGCPTIDGAYTQLAPKGNSSIECSYTVSVDEVFSIGAWLWADASESTQLRVVLEEPVAGEVHGGIGNLRGWAIASEPIDRIEIYIDGVFAFNAPYGGSRPDVAEQFPAVPGSEQSGFSLAYGYANLEAGTHTITAKAITTEGNVAESTSTFTVVRFDEVFIGPEQPVDTTQAVITVAGDEVLMSGVKIGEKLYSLRLKWRTSEQGFEIVEIQ